MSAIDQVTDVAARPGQVRNKGYEQTHREMIECAVRLISENGSAALSVAALARAMEIDRTTVYYHFPNRQALLNAVAGWATAQLAKGMDPGTAQPERIGQIGRFVLENPDLIKLWIDDFVAGGDIRDSYSGWDAFVAGIEERFAAERPDEEVDAEVYSAMLLSAAIVGLRVFANSVRPGISVEVAVERFRKEQQRMLRRDGLIEQPD